MRLAIRYRCYEEAQSYGTRRIDTGDVQRLSGLSRGRHVRQLEIHADRAIRRDLGRNDINVQTRTDELDEVRVRVVCLVVDRKPGLPGRAHQSHRTCENQQHQAVPWCDENRRR